MEFHLKTSTKTGWKILNNICNTMQRVKPASVFLRSPNAFIFSALTGLRWSDIEKLVWSEVQHSEQSGYYIRFRQKKTKGAETLPISGQAFQLLGERRKPEENV